MTLTWRGGSLSETTLMKIRRFTGQNEGRVAYFYLDSRSLVTVAVGYYCATENDAAQLSFVDKTTKAPAGTANSHTASFYESHTTLVLPDTEINRLLDVMLQEFYLDLVEIFRDSTHTQKKRRSPCST